MTRTPDELFGLEVAAIREGKGWSKAEFATRLAEAGLDNFHPTTVGRMEKGSRPVRLSEAVVIAQVLETRLDDLVVEPLIGDEELEHAINSWDYVSKHAAYYMTASEGWLREARKELEALEGRIQRGEVLQEHTAQLEQTCRGAAHQLTRDLIADWLEIIRGMSPHERRAFYQNDFDFVGSRGVHPETDPEVSHGEHSEPTISPENASAYSGAAPITNSRVVGSKSSVSGRFVNAGAAKAKPKESSGVHPEA